MESLPQVSNAVAEGLYGSTVTLSLRVSLLGFDDAFDNGEGRLNGL